MRHYMIPFSRTGLEAGLVRFLKPAGPITFVDIGASTGEFTEAVRKYCGLRRALLIEPQPALAARLPTRFAQLDICVKQCAISDSDRAAEMDILNWHYSSSLLPVARDVAGVDKVLDLNVRERVRVDVRRLDTVMAELPWKTEAIDLLKVDVQGGELAVFRGAPETLRRTGMVWTEVSFRSMYAGAASFADIHSFMYQSGFVLLWLSQGLRGEGGELLEGDALFARKGAEASH